MAANVARATSYQYGFVAHMILLPESCCCKKLIVLFRFLALSFLIMVGLTLVVEGFDVHVPKGYIYFAMAFSVIVELINIRMRKSKEMIELNKNLPGEKPKQNN